MEDIKVSILFVVVVVLVALWLIWKRKNTAPSEDKLQKQKGEYEALLARYQVPEEHFRLVVGQSKQYSLYNCPAVAWKEEGIVKILMMRQNPVVAEYEEEDFLFLASQPYLDFKQFDGTEYPDWAVQSAYVKQLFMPYVNLGKSVGGIDYKRQMYWAGTICVYPNSMAVIFKMLGRPLSDYENRVDNKKLMKEDGSIPAEMLEAIVPDAGTEKGTAAAAVVGNTGNPAFLPEASAGEMGDLLEQMNLTLSAIRQTERNAGAKEAAERINNLTLKLIEAERLEDLKKAAEDSEYQKKLLNELGL